MPSTDKPTDLQLLKLLDRLDITFRGEPVTFDVIMTTIPKEQHSYVSARLRFLRDKKAIEVTRESPMRYRLTGNCEGCPAEIMEFLRRRSKE